MDHPKDPERVRLGRLGALALHASGKTNTQPARAAWEASLAAEYGIDDSLSARERERRLSFAMRARMAQLAAQRWHGAPKRPGKSRRKVLDPTKPWCSDATCDYPQPHYHRLVA